MYEIKNKIFLEFSKTQKSVLCGFLRALVKKSPDLSAEDILIKFLEDEKYYQEINSSRLQFTEGFLNEEKFILECKLYIIECKKYYDYKKKQEPVIKAKKEYEKKKRKFMQEVKMSKEKPTKKQIYYYEKLCKRYDIKELDCSNLSKLDMRNEIEKILNEH